jgi:hypothetical protein
MNPEVKVKNVKRVTMLKTITDVIIQRFNWPAMLRLAMQAGDSTFAKQ